VDFEALVAPYLHDLRSYCLYLAKCKWDSEDLYQDTLLKCYIYSDKITQTGSVKALLFTTAKHLWIDEYRKRRGRIIDTRLLGAPAHRDANYADIRGLLEELAQRLPLRYIELLLLSEVYRYSMQEIADSTGSTVTAVKCALHRARSVLRGKEARSRAVKEPACPADIDGWTRAIVYNRPVGIPARREKLLVVS